MGDLGSLFSYLQESFQNNQECLGKILQKAYNNSVGAEILQIRKGSTVKDDE